MIVLYGKVAPKKVLRGRVACIVVIDKTLSIEGACADAKATGEEIAKAKKMASDANTAAANAQNTANSAGSAAAGAMTAANKAQTAANNAQQTANQAKTAAENAQSGLNAHMENKNNPHGLTAKQLGVEEVEFLVDIGTDWEGEAKPYTQTIPVPGITGRDEPVMHLAIPDDLANVDDLECEFSKISKFKTAENSITVLAKAPTDISIQVRLVLHRLGPGDDPDSDYNADLVPGEGPVSASVNGTTCPMSNMELGAAPSAPNKLSFEIL